MAEKKKLGQVLLDAGLLDEFQLKSALGFQQKWGGKLGDVLVENHFITEDALLIAIQQQTGIAVVKLEGRTIPDYLKKIVPFELIEKHRFVPIGLDGEPGKLSETLVVAMSDPTDLNVLDEIEFSTGKRVKPVLASKKQIEQIIMVQYRNMPAVASVGFDAGNGAAGLDSSMVDRNRLESPPPSQVDLPSSAGGMAEDPFAELDSLGSLPEASAMLADVDKSQTIEGSLLDDDPFAELDALSIVGSAVDGVDIDLDAEDEHKQELEELEVLEELDDMEIIEELSSTSVSPSGVSLPGAPPGQDFPGVHLPTANAADVAKNPLDDLPDLDPISGSDILTPPELSAPQALDDDPFSGDDDLDLDDVVGVLSADENNPDRDAITSPAHVLPDESDREHLTPPERTGPTMRIDPSTISSSASYSDQVTTVVQLPLAPDENEHSGAEDAQSEHAKPMTQPSAGQEVLARQSPSKAEDSVTTTEVNPTLGSGVIKSDAMKELLSRVGLKKGRKDGRRTSYADASGSAATKTPEKFDSVDSITLKALVQVLLKKGIVTEEELQEAKDRSSNRADT